MYATLLVTFPLGLLAVAILAVGATVLPDYLGAISSGRLALAASWDPSDRARSTLIHGGLASGGSDSVGRTQSET